MSKQTIEKFMANYREWITRMLITYGEGPIAPEEEAILGPLGDDRDNPYYSRAVSMNHIRFKGADSHISKTGMEFIKQIERMDDE